MEIINLIAEQTIKSYVMRNKQLPVGQQQKLADLLARYQLNLDHPDIPVDKPIEVEIGYGRGETIYHYAATNPQTCQIGFEVYVKGTLALLEQIANNQLTNVRVVTQDAAITMPQLFDPEQLKQIRVFYPDPWPKRRHIKRRLVNEQFLSLCAKLLAPKAVLHFATDWQDYFEQVAKLADTNNWRIVAAGTSQQARNQRPLTRYESKAIQEGRVSRDLRLQKPD